VVDLKALRIVARLKWTLTLRYYQRHWGTGISVLLGLAAMLVIAAVGGGVLFAYTHAGGPAARDAALAWATWILVLLWLFLPLMQFDIQRNLDLNGLRLMPLSGPTFSGAVLVDSVLSPQGIMFLPLLIAALACFSLNLAELPLVLFALFLMTVGMLGLGQALYLWASRMLTSRRFSDIMILVSALLFVALQSANLYIHTREDFALPPWLPGIAGVLHAIITPLLEWGFPGLTARMVASWTQGQWESTLGFCLFLAFQAVLCCWLAGFAARQFYQGQLESAGTTRAKRRGLPSPATQAARPLLLPPLGTLFSRDRLYLWRDPVLKMLLIQTLLGAVYIGLFLSLAIWPHREQGFLPIQQLGQYLPLGLAFFLSYAESAVLFNKFGYEGHQLIATLLTPVSRRRMLLAKSLFYQSHFVLVNFVLVAGLSIALHAPPLIACTALLVLLANSIMVDLAGHFVSIYFPFTFRRRGRRMRAVPPQPGCLFALLYTLLFQLCNLAVLPGSAAIIAGALLGGWPGLVLGTLLAVALILIAYHFGLPQAALLLQRREPELISVLARDTS